MQINEEKNMKYGLQLYSLRDITKTDFEGALRAVAEMGYKMVEPAGFFGYSAEDVRAMLDCYGLEVCSTHTPYKSVFEDIRATIDYHKKIGCKNIIIPSAPYGTREAVTYTVDSINRFLPMIEAEGMSLHFHNHSGEFLPNIDGQIAEEEFASRTNVKLQLDTFWVFNAGLDPVATIEKYRDRVSIIHLKDGIPAAGEVKAQGKSIGLGQAPVEAVRAKAIALGLDIVVESEGLEPTGLEEVRRCIDFLKTLDARDGN